MKRNWDDHFNSTLPAPKIYPYQWSWDSGLVSIGNSYIDIERAMLELDSLFNAQWKNGMIPHIVFHRPSETYWPSPKYHEIQRSKNSPKHVLTSGMTQPPIHAISCYYIYRNAHKKLTTRVDREKVNYFLKRMFPKLQNFHRYLLTDRDPEHSGLATIFHPWESGMDNSPIWDFIVKKIIKENKGNLPSVSRRKDIRALYKETGDTDADHDAARRIREEEKQRPSENLYRVFIFLLDQMKQCNYDEEIMYKTLSFKVKDVLFNSIFYLANKCLQNIASVINIDDGANSMREIKGWLRLQKMGFTKYLKRRTSDWPAAIETRRKRTIRTKTTQYVYYDFDVNENCNIKRLTFSCFIPMFAGLPNKLEVRNLIQTMLQKSYLGINNKSCFRLVPSYYAEEGEGFDPERYWRGPVWININWMFYYGLLENGYRRHAEEIKRGILSLVQREGFWEYYHTFTGKGLGAKNFSWTSALTLDLICSEKNSDFKNSSDKV
jgi:hypothetical protein